MKVNINNIGERERTINTGGNVVIASNIKKESVMLDRNGNEIDPRTKQIINNAEKE